MSNDLDKQLQENKEERDVHLTANPGDRIDESKSVEEKKEQTAVESWDPAGKVEVPTYFPVETEEGEEKALHHVKDAQEISDTIRQARVDEDGERQWW